MEIEGKGFLVAGASGALGSRFARELDRRGARLALTARDPATIVDLAAELDAAAIELEITGPSSRAAAVERAAGELGTLDGLVVATGAVAFGRSGEIDPAFEERLMSVNATGPMGLIAAALARMADGGAVVVLSAVVAEYPTAGMAAYSASKAALSAYIAALRRERRRELSAVIDVRPGHMETGFSGRALSGDPPRMPEPEDPDELVAAAIEALAAEKREVAYDPMKRSLETS
ncbi:MAG: SDR family oxidoreductase [Actinomycetota bacterium]|nr:SDR family oxidoreductase [Actinomycetota bacterium]